MYMYVKQRCAMDGVKRAKLFALRMPATYWSQSHSTTANGMICMLLSFGCVYGGRPKRRAEFARSLCIFAVTSAWASLVRSNIFFLSSCVCGGGSVEVNLHTCVVFGESVCCVRIGGKTHGWRGQRPGRQILIYGRDLRCRRNSYDSFISLWCKFNKPYYLCRKSEQ